MRATLTLLVVLAALAAPGPAASESADAEEEYDPCQFLECTAPDMSIRMGRALYSEACRHFFASAQVSYGTRWLDVVNWELTDSDGVRIDGGEDRHTLASAYANVLIPLARGDFPFDAYLPDGRYTVSVRASNSAGADEASASFDVGDFEDVTPPTSSPILYPDDGASSVNGWYTSPILVGFEVEDDCLATVEASLDGASVPSWFVVDTEGRHLVVWRAVDQAGNAEAWRDTTLAIDLMPPEIAILKPHGGDVIVDNAVVVSTSGEAPAIVVGPLTLEGLATDSASGVARVTWLVDNIVAGEGESIAVSLAPGRHVIEAIAEDFVGRTTRSEAVEILVLPSPP